MGRAGKGHSTQSTGHAKALRWGGWCGWREQWGRQRWEESRA